MTIKEWEKRITQATKDVGTYHKSFADPIATLALILAQRDDALADYIKRGSKVMLEHTNQAGAKNLEQNPTLRLVNDLNRDALTYWRELGLTPSGLRKINDEALKGKPDNPLAKVLAAYAP